MTQATEEIGLLLVHGMGEQKRLDHLEASARELASFIAADPDLVRIGISDEAAAAEKITLDAVFRRKGAEERVRLHLHEVWWADLGISGGFLEQLRFWLWGLGQWAAEAARRGDPTRNTEKLMAMPRFAYQASPMDTPSFIRKLPSRLMLFGAALLAILTFFTWSAAKQLVSLLSKRLPEPSLVFLFLGDVKIYERPGGPGKGTLLDPDMPMRTTIRRRVVSAIAAMAGRQQYDRWYLFAHSLGTVPAYNALQETEWALPNYLSESEWKALPATFKTNQPFTPAGEAPTVVAMMPRRPPWLAPTDGIDRSRLFERFAGFVTYGSPLDKFAALWPRVVCLNRQAAVFPKNSEWVNLHDPTDPVAAKLDAFAEPLNRADGAVKDRIALVPKNFACRASLMFGLSHIRYFRPRRNPSATMAGAISRALMSGERIALSEAAAGAATSAGEAWGRMVAAVAQVALLGLALTGAAAALLLAIGKALPDRATAIAKQAVGALSPDLLAALQGGGWPALWASAIIVVALCFAAVLVGGLARMIADVRRAARR